VDAIRFRRRKKKSVLVGELAKQNIHFKSLTDAIDTHYIAAAIAQFKAEGYMVNDEDSSYQLQTRFDEINVHGKISFNISEELKRKGLRPFRKHDEY